MTATVESPCKYPSGLASDGTHLYLADWREARIFQMDRDGTLAAVAGSEDRGDAARRTTQSPREIPSRRRLNLDDVRSLVGFRPL